MDHKYITCAEFRGLLNLKKTKFFEVRRYDPRFPRTVHVKGTDNTELRRGGYLKTEALRFAAKYLAEQEHIASGDMIRVVSERLATIQDIADQHGEAK